MLLKFEEEVVRWLVEEVRKCSLVVEPEGNVMVEEEVVGEMVEVVMEEEELSLRVVMAQSLVNFGYCSQFERRAGMVVEVMACFTACSGMLLWAFFFAANSILRDPSSLLLKVLKLVTVCEVVAGANELSS